MTNKPGGFSNVNELLRKIEKFLLKAYNLLDSYADMVQKATGTSEQPRKEAQELHEALEALASLRSLLESDAGEDEKTIKKVLDLGRELCETNYGVACFGEAENALSRLSAKAKIGETKIREAKREVLEATNDFMQEVYRDTNSIRVRDVMSVLEHYISDRKTELAVLKEAGT